jgi:hypothetical protein
LTAVHSLPLGFPGHAVGVAQAGGEDAVLAAGAVDFPDRGAACSASRPFSPTLLLEPTLTYSLLPSWLAMTFLVQ